MGVTKTVCGLSLAVLLHTRASRINGGDLVENTTRGNIFEMLETILKIAGIIVTGFSTIVKAIDLADRFKHRKSNRPSPK